MDTETRKFVELHLKIGVNVAVLKTEIAEVLGMFPESTFVIKPHYCNTDKVYLLLLDPDESKPVSIFHKHQAD